MPLKSKEDFTIDAFSLLYSYSYDYRLASHVWLQGLTWLQVYPEHTTLI